jgi:hypothetical protein
VAPNVTIARKGSTLIKQDKRAAKSVLLEHIMLILVPRLSKIAKNVKLVATVNSKDMAPFAHIVLRIHSQLVLLNVLDVRLANTKWAQILAPTAQLGTTPITSTLMTALNAQLDTMQRIFQRLKMNVADDTTNVPVAHEAGTVLSYRQLTKQ